MAQKTILYVDDEEDIRLVASACLEADGYRVLTAASAADALKIVFVEFPDLLITDVMMPGESGYSLCAKVRKDPSTKDLPVLIMTVLDNEKEAMEAGATAFLNKPFDEAELRKTVKGILMPGDTRALLNNGLEMLRFNQVEKAAATFEEIVKNEPASEIGMWARYYLAQIHHQQGSVASSQAELRALLGIDGTFYRAHNRLGLVLEEAGEGKTAMRHYQRSLAINGGQPDVQQRLEALLKAQ